MKLENLKRAHRRAMIAVYDFDEARYYLESVTEETPDRLVVAAVLASVISYCRPFLNSNEGKDRSSHPRINLKPEKVLAKCEQYFHREIINVRNSVIAHSDFDYKESRVLSESKIGYSFSVPQTHQYLLKIDRSKLHNIADKFGKAIQVEAYRLFDQIRAASSGE